MKRYIAIPLIATAIQVFLPGGAKAQTAISFGETVVGSIAIFGEVDTFTFSANANDRVVVTMSWISGEFEPDLSLYDPQGALLCSAVGGFRGSAQLDDECSLEATGIYTITADDDGNTETGEYGLYLQRLNKPGNATALSFGQTVTGAVQTSAQKDTYTFIANANDRVVVTMGWISGEFEPNLGLYDSQGILLCSAVGGFRGSAQLDDECFLEANGIYTITADDDGNTETGEYGLYLQRLNNPGNVTALSFGQTVTGAVQTSAQKDTYTFIANANDRVVVTMGWISGEFEPNLGLYDSQGILLCSAVGGFRGSAQLDDECSLEATGIYTITADDDGNTETGEYALYLQRLNNPGNATALTFGQTVAGTIEARTEKDVYTFSAFANDRVIVSMTTSTGNLQPEMELYDPQGLLLCSSRGSDSTQIDSCTLPVTGTYAVLADDRGDTDTGDYYLHLQRLNGPGNATGLTFGQSVDATVGVPAEKDAYTFSAASGDSIFVRMVAHSGGLTPDLAVYDPAGILICSEQGLFGLPAQIEDCSVPVGGVFLILADARGNTETGDYSLFLDRLSCGLTCEAEVPVIGEIGASLEFSANASASACDGSVMFNWTFGDGAFSTDQTTTHAYSSEGAYEWTLTASIEDETCVRTGTIAIRPPRIDLPGTVLFDDFDFYPPGSNLDGQGGWENRWGGGITASGEHAASPPQSCRIDNNNSCWESQLFHPLPFLEVLWFSADIMGIPTGRSGCHEFDAVVQLFNPDEGGRWGSSPVRFTLRSGPGEFNLDTGLTVLTSRHQLSGVYGWQDFEVLEPDYDSLVNRWINLQAKVDYRRHLVDIWVDGEYRGNLALDPTAPPYTGIALDTGNGLGFFDNVWVFEDGPEPGDDALELTLDEPYPSSIPRERYRFFQVTSQPGRDLLVTLDQSGQLADLELYGRVGRPPSRSVYSAYDSGQTGAAHQSLAFPATEEPETYFFLVYHAGGPSAAPFTILARHPGFHLDRVSPSTVSNAGSVTLTVVGSELSPNTEVRLLSPSRGVRAAVGKIFVNSTRIQANFNLASAETGLYDLRAVDPEAGSSTLVDALRVTEGDPGILRATLDAPSDVRPDRNYTVWLRYGNDGGADLRAPLFVVSSPQAVPMRLSSVEPFRRGPIQVLGVNMDTPVGVLPPGSGFSIPIQFRSSTSANEIQFDLEMLPPGPTPIDWDAVEQEARPAGIQDDAWNAIWTNLTARVGATWADYLATLTDAASYLATHYREAPGALDPDDVPPQERMPVAVYSVRNLFAFELAKASSGLSPRPVLTVALDAFYPAPALPLVFARIAPSPLEQRFRLGTLGRGWAHIYDYTVRDGDDGSVLVRDPWGQDRLFLPNGDGTFSGAVASENGIMQAVAEGYLLQERDGFVLGFAGGRLAYLQDTNGNRLTMVYGAGLLTSVTHSNGDALTIEYNSDERIASVVDPAGRTSLYFYDAGSEHLTSVQNDGRRNTSYSYHPVDGTAEAHALEEIEFPGGVHRYLGYDRFGRLESEWRDGGAEQLNYAYDAQGTVTISDTLGGAVTMHLGYRGQLLDLTTSEGGRLSLAYDDVANLTRIADTTGSETMLAYDDHGNPLGARDAAGAITRFSYGALFNRMETLVDAGSNTTGFDYDGSGNLIHIEYPDDSAEWFALDAEGKLASYTNRRMQTFSYAWNRSEQLTEKISPDAPTIELGYAERGNLDTVSVSGATIDLDFDDRDFLSRIEYPGGHFFAFEHDPSGRRTRRTDESGFSISYEYDEAGRMEVLRDGSGVALITYSYDPAGRLVREVRGNGTSTTYAYDSAGQLLNLVHLAPDDTIQARFEYTYDERGNRTSMTTLEGTTEYEYDALSQLTGVTYPDGSTATYIYDASGNRVTVSQNGQNESYSNNELNQYTVAGDTTFTYDDDGNMTSRTDGTGTTAYTYDAENRIVRVVSPSGEIWEHTYDALGNRVSVTHDGIETRYLHDPIGLVDVVAEYDGSGNLIARYVHGLGLAARIDTAGNTAYYGYDALGSTRQLTDDSGAVIATYDYDPWGVSVAVTENHPNPFRWIGRFGVMESGSGLVYMRGRSYLPEIGRFVSVDPLAFAVIDTNLFSYVGNNPLLFIDPLGLQRTFLGYLTAIGRGAAQGALVGFGEGVVKGAFTISFIAPSGGTAGGAYLAIIGGSMLKGAILSGIGGAISYRTGLNSTAVGGGIGFLQGTVTSGFIGGPGGLVRGTIKATALGSGTSWLGSRLPLFDNSTGVAIESENIPTVNVDSSTSNVIRPVDPNEKTGPDPIVRPGERVTYTIYFQNLETATAPAQEVFITDNLDSDLDWSTFELGDVTFGDAVVTSLGGRLDGFDRITYGDYWIDIQATRSPSGDQINWTLRSLDPNTGELPDDPFAGFLPPEDGTGRGQGHVTFSIEIPSDATDGTEISNSASIVFDTNPPISTNTWTSTVQSPSDCAASELCLHDERFRVEVAWRDFNDNIGMGSPNRLSDESGYFTFFGPTNAEVFIKVLDACGLAGNYWVFDAHLSNVEYTITVTDTQTGQTRTIFNPLGYTAPSVLGTTTLFTECAGGDGAGLPTSELVNTNALPPNGTPLVQETEEPSVVGPCLEDPNTMCLNGGRFRVHATFEDFQGNPGVAKQWTLTSDSGYSTFFSDSNVELFIKVLDACGLTGNYWVFASGLTNVEIDLYVEDTESGKVWHASNPLGRVFATALDTQTFFTGCS